MIQRVVLIRVVIVVVCDDGGDVGGERIVLV